MPYRDGDERVDLAATSSCGTPRGSGWTTKFGHAVSLEIEPGRYLVAESG